MSDWCFQPVQLECSQYRSRGFKLLANCRALANKHKAFVIEIYGEKVSYLTRAYVEQARNIIVDRLQNTLPATEQEHFETLLTDMHLGDRYL